MDVIVPTGATQSHETAPVDQQDGQFEKIADLSTSTDAADNPLTITSNLAKQIECSESASQVLVLIEGLKVEDLREISSDVVQCLCKFLNETNGDQETVMASKRIFNRMARSLEPKECLILLIEHARERWTDALFYALLLPVTKLLRRTKPPVGSSLAFALDAITEFLTVLPLPPVLNDLEGKERLMLDTDPCVVRIYDTVPQFINFIRPFVKRVSWCTVAQSTDLVDVDRQITCLCRCLLSVVGRPLGYVDLSHDHAKSTGRMCADHCVRFIGQLYPDFVRLLVEQPGLLEKPSDVLLQGLSTFAFLAFGENLLPDHIPSVYSHQFLIELNAPLVSRLLEQMEVFPRLHGIQLCISLLEKFESNSISMELIESEVMRNLVLAVVKVTVTAKSKEFNMSSLKILTLICATLEPAGKLQYLYAMLRIAPRTGGVVSCVIGMVANEILSNIDKDSRNFFTGPDLEKLLQLVFALPNGEKTDLLENSERIMAALKLLGRVLPRDKRQNNFTGIWNVIPAIELKYFRLLFGGLELSRAHYQLEIQKLKGLRHGEPTGREFVSRGNMVELSKHQQIGVMETAIQTFDMMESVAKQMIELIHSAQNAQSS